MKCGHLHQGPSVTPEIPSSYVLARRQSIQPPCRPLKYAREYAERFLNTELAEDCSMLCDQCRKIDFQRVFQLEDIPNRGINVLSVCSCCFKADQNCSLCRYIYEQVRGVSFEKVPTCHLRAVSASCLIDDSQFPILTHFYTTYRKFKKGQASS